MNTARVVFNDVLSYGDFINLEKDFTCDGVTYKRLSCTSITQEYITLRFTAEPPYDDILVYSSYREPAWLDEKYKTIEIPDWTGQGAEADLYRIATITVETDVTARVIFNNEPDYSGTISLDKDFTCDGVTYKRLQWTGSQLIFFRNPPYGGVVVYMESRNPQWLDDKYKTIEIPNWSGSGAEADLYYIATVITGGTQKALILNDTIDLGEAFTMTTPFASGSTTYTGMRWDGSKLYYLIGDTEVLVYDGGWTDDKYKLVIMLDWTGTGSQAVLLANATEILPIPPKTDRISPRPRTTAVDMNRITINMICAGGVPKKLHYTDDDIVRDIEWLAICDFAKTKDSEITYSTHWTNLNAIERALAGQAVTWATYESYSWAELEDRTWNSL